MPDMTEPASTTGIRLVTFLGTGGYKETTYTWTDSAGEVEKCRTPFVARAIATRVRATEVVVLATEESWQTHGTALNQQILDQGLPSPRPEIIPLGATPAELWVHFETTCRLIRAKRSKIVLDITHGFRSSPFYSAAAVAFTRMIDNHLPAIEVYYGAFNPKEPQETPLWNLTPFIELLDWSRNLMLFLHTGRAEELAQTIESHGRELNRQWAGGDRSSPRPEIAPFASSLKKFGSDLETLRIGSLLVGSLDGRPASTTNSLLRTLRAARNDLATNIPPVADILDRLEESVSRLHFEGRLSDDAGQRAAVHLARYYLEMGRYSEASVTIREAFVTRHAGNQADWPGTADCTAEARLRAEDTWFQLNQAQARTHGDTRNDVQHGGFRVDPKPSETLKNQIWKMIDDFEQGISVTSPPQT